MHAVVRHQSIIQAPSEFPGPLRFDLTRSHEMQSKHPPYCGMTRRSHVMNKQGGFGCMENCIVGPRYRVFPIIGSHQSLRRTQRPHSEPPLSEQHRPVHSTDTPWRSTASL